MSTLKCIALLVLFLTDTTMFVHEKSKQQMFIKSYNFDASNSMVIDTTVVCVDVALYFTSFGAVDSTPFWKVA